MELTRPLRTLGSALVLGGILLVLGGSLMPAASAVCTWQFNLQPRSVPSELEVTIDPTSAQIMGCEWQISPHQGTQHPPGYKVGETEPGGTEEFDITVDGRAFHVTVEVADDASSGDYSFAVHFDIRCTGGDCVGEHISVDKWFYLIVIEPCQSLELDYESLPSLMLNLSQQNQAVSDGNIVVRNKWEGRIKISFIGPGPGGQLPPGVKASASPNNFEVKGPARVQIRVTITASPTTPAGIYPIKIKIEAIGAGSCPDGEKIIPLLLWIFGGGSPGPTEERPVSIYFQFGANPFGSGSEAIIGPVDLPGPASRASVGLRFSTEGQLPGAVYKFSVVATDKATDTVLSVTDPYLTIIDPQGEQPVPEGVTQPLPPQPPATGDVVEFPNALGLAPIQPPGQVFFITIHRSESGDWSVGSVPIPTGLLGATLAFEVSENFAWGEGDQLFIQFGSNPWSLSAPLTFRWGSPGLPLARTAPISTLNVEPAAYKFSVILARQSADGWEVIDAIDPFLIIGDWQPPESAIEEPAEPLPPPLEVGEEFPPEGVEIISGESVDDLQEQFPNAVLIHVPVCYVFETSQILVPAMTRVPTDREVILVFDVCGV